MIIAEDSYSSHSKRHGVSAFLILGDLVTVGTSHFPRSWDLVSHSFFQHNNLFDFVIYTFLRWKYEAAHCDGDILSGGGGLALAFTPIYCQYIHPFAVTSQLLEDLRFYFLSPSKASSFSLLSLPRACK